MSSKVYPYTHPSITPVISLSIRHLPVYDQLFANGGEEGNVGLAPILLIKWPGSFRLDRFRALQPEPSTNRSCSYTSATISSSSSSDLSSSDSSSSTSSLSSSLTSVVLCRRWPRGMRESKHDLKKFRNLFMFAVPITIKSTQGRHLREEHGETTKSSVWYLIVVFSPEVCSGKPVIKMKPTTDFSVKSSSCQRLAFSTAFGRCCW